MPKMVPRPPAVTAWLTRHPLARWLAKQQRDLPTRGLRFRKLVTVTGVNRQTVYHWLNGLAFPPPSRLVAIRKVTGVSADDWARWFEARPQSTEEDRAEVRRQAAGLGRSHTEEK